MKRIWLVILISLCIYEYSTNGICQSPIVDVVDHVARSPTIAVVTVQGIDLVIDKAKVDESIKRGTIDMKNYIGFQYRLQVVEVFKMALKTRGAGVISVYVPMETFTAGPALLKGQKYVVLLDHLNEDPELFAHAMIREYGKPALTVFQPKDKYVIKSSSDAVRVIPANSALIERIRQVVRSAPQQK